MYCDKLFCTNRFPVCNDCLVFRPFNCHPIPRHPAGRLLEQLSASSMLATYHPAWQVSAPAQNGQPLVGILQNMVNPYLAPTQPEGSELSTFSYGGEGIPRVLKQYRLSLHGYISPIRWSNQLNQSERLIYAPLAWITTDSGNGLVSSLFAWTNFALLLTVPLGTNCSDFLVVWKKYLEMICKL